MTKKIPVPMKKTPKDKAPKTTREDKQLAKRKLAQEELSNLYDESYVDISKKVSTEEFLREYMKCGGNASRACRNLKISYTLYTKIRKSNPELIENARESIKEKEKEYIYDKLLLLVASGNVPATIFACKSILGMKETQDINIEQGGINIKEALEEIKKELDAGDQ